MNTTSNYSSTASLLSQKASTSQQPQPKNYEAAFGSLASSYGFPGTAPLVPKSQSQNKSATVNSTNTSRASSAPAKNYESAFGNLSSMYGLGAGVPSLAARNSTSRHPPP
ncbi:hypothetical protein BD779DRAFT_1652071 [Infundibulicybe gibba]|nr:hypothetical protein BD779DRAFT_1574405 [Infundibulicybe gibba]KAF8873341.1 hypothetical protein BD779DRAFT_1652071 [Infundibulicybe gibba]